MRIGLILFTILLVAALPVVAQTPAKSPFTVEFDPDKGVSEEQANDGKGLRFTIKFKITRHGARADEPGKDYKVVVYHDKREVARLDVPRPKISDELSAVLAIDISGSMGKDIQGKANSKRIDQARIAARSFMTSLPARADCGLILFDHEIRADEKIAPKSDRQMLHDLIDKMQARGGTAYLDAVKEGVAMLAKLPAGNKHRSKAVVIMTDGVDLNSKTTLAEVIKYAKAEKVKVYTIGIGMPGTGQPVTSVLVLDHSQSMELPADDNDARPKIQALHTAASRFVEIMPKTAYTTVLPFGSIVDVPQNFTQDKHKLVQQINSLKPKGETAMLDAAYDAVATLEAARLVNHHLAVVVMTDGIDNISRHRPDDVIQRAKEANVSMHMLAFGRESELKQARDDMQRIARETGGTFNHARNEKDLIRIFEDMSIALHDDGIDEKSLTQLAKDTGGEYRPARDVSKLHFILEEISQELSEKEYSITFPAPHGFDGSRHNFRIQLESSTGQVIGGVGTDRAIRGVVVAEMNPLIYLGFLAVLGMLLGVPMALGRALRSST
jgi:VWFA-related protein